MNDKIVETQVKRDHLERIARKGTPLGAIEELIWNSLDADSTLVEVSFRAGPLGQIEAITVSDNGSGIPAHEVDAAFGSLGGSWKRLRETTRNRGRILHGKEGKGRFRSFLLGNHVQWVTRYEDDGELYEINISGSGEWLGKFRVSLPAHIASEGSTGTTVIVDPVWDDLAELRNPTNREELAHRLALYLSQYPKVQVQYDGEFIDIAATEVRRDEYPLDFIEVQGVSISDAKLAIIEWGREQERWLYLCDSRGFTLAQVRPRIHAPGFNFTAYLTTAYFREHGLDAVLELAELEPAAAELLEAAKQKLRLHFRKRAAEEAKSVVEEWKSEQIYPYQNAAEGVVEVAERQVFDIVAYNVHHYLPSFAEADRHHKQFSLRLIRQAIEENPRTLRTILNEVLSLPKETQDELAELLERTSLGAVIEASKEVANRLDFLRGFEVLVFRPSTREDLQERSQLHRILATECWIFGEQHHLSVDDRSLTEVLRKHLEVMRRESYATDANNLKDEEVSPVLRGDGSVGIVDLMFSRRVPQPNQAKRHHLVVELKRPKQAINGAVTTQIQSYASAVQKDERFRHTDTTWEFWAISNRITDEVASWFEDSETGLYKRSEDGRFTIYLRTWGELLEENRARLTFFQERLRYDVDDDSAMRYLRRTYEKYLPESVLSESDGDAA